MTTKEYNQLVQIIKRCEDNINFLSVEEVDALKRSCEYAAYFSQVKDFKTHIDKMLQEDTCMCDENFFNLDWTISINNKSVTLHMCADIYNDISDMLDNYIKEYE